MQSIYIYIHFSRYLDIKMLLFPLTMVMMRRWQSILGRNEYKRLARREPTIRNVQMQRMTVLASLFWKHSSKTKMRNIEASGHAAAKNIKHIFSFLFWWNIQISRQISSSSYLKVKLQIKYLFRFYIQDKSRISQIQN